MIWIIESPFKSIYKTPKDFSRVSFSIECRTLTVGLFWNELQHMQHVIVIINNKYFTIDKTNYFSLLDFFFVHAFVAVLQHYYLFCKNRYNIVILQVILHFCLFLHDAERSKRGKTRFCTMQKGKKEQKHASARRRKAKKRKNTLLHDAESSKRAKTRFCTMQKGQKEQKHASARCRKAKKRKNTHLHDAERPKREKTRFCTAQKGQKEKNYASERLRKGRKRKNTFLSDSERAKKRKNTFLSDSERAKKRKNMFLSDSERLKSEKTSF